jgi:putative transposase
MRLSPTRSRKSTSVAARTYAYPRVSMLSLELWECVALAKRVARLMRKASLRGCLRGRRKRTTRRDKHALPAPDLVNRNFFYAIAPDRLWTADNITYVHTQEEGFVHLAFILDVYSRRVVGWSTASHLRTELVVDALEMALWRRKPDAGLISIIRIGAHNTRPSRSASAWRKPR